MSTIAARALGLLLPLILVSAVVDKPARADEVLLTFGDMVRLQRLPLDSTKRALTEEEVILYQNFEFYAYTVFESLQVANSAAALIDQTPLFCAPEGTFHFSEDGDIARLADYVTAELFALTEEIGGPTHRYDDKPASLVLLLGLRAAFPCEEPASVVAQH